MDSMKIIAESATSEFPMMFGLLLPVLLVGLWCFVCFLLSRVGGWSRLAGKFAAKGTPAGTAFYGQSAQFSGFANYRNCLTIIVAGEGLYLKVWPIFGLRHKPILIPWHEIGNVRHRSFLWMRTASFDAGIPKIARISISEKVFQSFPESWAAVTAEGRQP